MERHNAALTLAASALLLGLAGDLLLRWVPWGANAPAWTVLLVVVALVCAVRMKREVALFLALCAIVAAAGLAWRDSGVLRALDIALILLFLPMLALRARGVRLAAAGISEVALALVTTAVQTAAGFPQLVFADVTWSQLPRRGTLRGGGVVARGVVIATPALILFTSLLMSADAAFAKVMKDLVFIDVREATGHVLVTALLAV